MPSKFCLVLQNEDSALLHCVRIDRVVLTNEIRQTLFVDHQSLNERFPLRIRFWLRIEEAIVGERVCDGRPPSLGSLRRSNHLVKEVKDGRVDLE